MCAVLAARADVARRIGGVRRPGGGVGRRGAGHERFLDGGCPQRRRPHAREGDLDATADIDRGDADRRPVARRSLVLEVDASLDHRNPDLGQQLPRPEGVGERSGEELRRRNHALSSRTSGDELGIESEHHRAEVGGRVGVGYGPTDRSPVANLGVADELGRLREHRAALRQHLIADELRMPRECADDDPLAVPAHVAQLVQPSDVDEQRRTHVCAQAEQRDQRVSACEQLRVVVAAEELDRLLDRPRPLVGERGGDHAPALAAASTARTMLW